MATAQERDWEELAELDPLWAILSDRTTRYGQWDTDAFFATGEQEVEVALARLDELGGLSGHAAALDFGCGVGRVSRALAARFDHVVGLDISPTMVSRGREFNADVENLEFVQNSAEDLTVLGDRRFDLVYTRIVLQHLPDRDAARRFIEEFVRVLAPGGWLLFQIPMAIPLRRRLRVARRLYVLLRGLGIAPRTLYERFGLHPIRMLFVPEESLRAWVTAAGAEVVEIERSEYESVLSGTVYARRA